MYMYTDTLYLHNIPAETTNQIEIQWYNKPLSAVEAKVQAQGLVVTQGDGCCHWSWTSATLWIWHSWLVWGSWECHLLGWSLKQNDAGWQESQLGLSQDALPLRSCCGKRVCMRKEEEAGGLNKDWGVEVQYRHILHNIVSGFGLLSIVKVQLTNIHKILPLLRPQITLEQFHVLKHNWNNFTEAR